MTYETGQRITVLDAANLPCAIGDTGTVTEVRNAARDFPVGVKMDASGHVEWFRECEIEAQ